MFLFAFRNSLFPTARHRPHGLDFEVGKITVLEKKLERVFVLQEKRLTMGAWP